MDSAIFAEFFMAVSEQCDVYRLDTAGRHCLQAIHTPAASAGLAIFQPSFSLERDDDRLLHLLHWTKNEMESFDDSRLWPCADYEFSELDPTSCAP